MWDVELARAMQDLSSFSLCTPGFSRFPVPLIAVVLLSPLGLSRNAFSRGSISSLSPLPCHTWVSSTTRDQRIYIRGTVSTPYSKGRSHLRANQGFRNSGSSLPSWLSLSSAILLYRDDFPQTEHGVSIA